MSSRVSRRGGIIAVFLAGLAIAVSALIVGSIVIANNVHLQHSRVNGDSHVRLETPFGDVNVDARDNLKPESVRVPIYPGASREHGRAGALVLDFDYADRERGKLSVVTAEYSTEDSADQVRQFYREQLPHWIFSQRQGDDLHIEFSQGGYKRIVSIQERRGRTQIGIAAVGEPAVN
jgi:hypothetical protein